MRRENRYRYSFLLSFLVKHHVKFNLIQYVGVKEDILLI